MIVGFLGKGGSGKSTLSARYARFLLGIGKRVLAVDADHNMDLTYNLGVEGMPAHIGQGLTDVLAYAGVTGDYREAFALREPPVFQLAPPDPITKKYSVAVGDRLRVMSTGPHTDRILYDQTCSHSLVTPLKVYLPFLRLEADQEVVVDEKAGTDSVGTGVTTGFDAAVVVTEPTVHGLKAAKQIAEMLAFYETPSYFALNKRRDAADEERFIAQVGRAPDFVFGFDASAIRLADGIPEASVSEFTRLHQAVARLEDTRIKRSKEKFERANAFAS